MTGNEYRSQARLQDGSVRHALRATTARYSPAAAVLGIAYAVAHVMWSIASPPAFVRTESPVGPVWLGAIPAGVAVLGWFGLRAQRTSARTLAVCATGLGCATLGAYCLLLWPRLAQLLTVPFGEPFSGSEVGATVLALSLIHI